MSIPSRAEWDDCIRTLDYRNPDGGIQFFNFSYVIEEEGVRGRVNLLARSDDTESENTWYGTFEVPMTPKPPIEQYRDLLRGAVCHEVDERIWIAGERPYDPHAE